MSQLVVSTILDLPSNSLLVYRVNCRLCGTGDPLQGDVPWSGEPVRTTERPRSIGLPPARAPTRSGRRESTLVSPSRAFDLNEQPDDCVTVFDPVFAPSDVAYLKDRARYVLPSVRIENEGSILLSRTRSSVSQRITRSTRTRWRTCPIVTCPYSKHSLETTGLWTGSRTSFS
jgi:hypothetical protein